MPDDKLTFQDIIDNLAEVLGEMDGIEVARIYNSICTDQIEYEEDSVWKRVPFGLCKRCGTPLQEDGYCSDETCPYSDHLQHETFMEG